MIASNRAVQAPSGSRKTFHRFFIATKADIPTAKLRYEELVLHGTIHPKARAMYRTADGRCGPLSPPQAPSEVCDVINHQVKR